jgi:hypothetical protein
MFPLNLLVLVFALFQATPTPSPFRVSIVSSKSFWPETFAEWLGTVSALAIIGGGIWALRTYREGQRVKAAEMLLNMEQEFRVILPTYELIENPGVYNDKIVPMLREVMKGSSLKEEHIKLLGELDRCLRFLFLCSVLNQDLAVEHNALIRAYHHYVGILAELADVNNTKNVDLAQYIAKFYPTLCRWTTNNRALLASYRAGQQWKQPFWKFWLRRNV